MLQHSAGTIKNFKQQEDMYNEFEKDEFLMDEDEIDTPKKKEWLDDDEIDNPELADEELDDDEDLDDEDEEEIPM